MCAILVGVVSCGKTEKAAEADSIADTVLTDTVKAEESGDESVNIAEVLTLQVIKKDLKHVPESTFYTGYIIVKVVNNSESEIKGSDYEITYEEEDEDWVGTQEEGGLDYVTKQMSVPGKDIAPGEAVEITIKSDGCQDLRNPKIKVLK